VRESTFLTKIQAACFAVERIGVRNGPAGLDIRREMEQSRVCAGSTPLREEIIRQRKQVQRESWVVIVFTYRGKGHASQNSRPCRNPRQKLLWS